MTLFAELQRRKVFKVGAAYLVVGWLLIQIASTVAPQLNLPEWAPRLITFVILLGFPVAILLAWAIDLSSDGIRIDAAPLGNKRMIAAVALLVALAFGWYWKGHRSPDANGVDARSIAVLPFVNMSGDKDNEYFSDGISEEILNVLARTPALRVAARTSSFSFKDKATEVPVIAHELNVRMILEGSVRKQGDRVRITAQLIDASNGYHVWSQTYDRELKDIFAIQDEIANAIARELNVKLNATVANGVTVPDTTNLKAFDLYLQGTALWQARGDKNLYKALDAFHAALALDPNYAKAWAGLALTYTVIPDWSNMPLAESRPLARDAAEHAMALDPNLPEPYAALGFIAGSEYRFATARAMYQRSLAVAPSYATAYQWFGETLATEGDLATSLAKMRQAAALDPKSAIVSSILVNGLTAAGRDDEALTVCDSIVAVESEWCPLARFDLAMSRKDYAAARSALEASAAARGPEALAFFHAQMDALDGKGDVNAIAMKLLDLPDGQSNPTGLTPMTGTDAAYWYLAVGRSDLAVERFARFARLLPYNARSAAFDPHLAALHCEPKFQDVLRSLRIAKSRFAARCPKGGQQ